MKFPIGIQDFASLRREGYAYVDKTALVYKLAQENRYCFLARPRRFGKSLLLSTFRSYFSGEKELFQGLALEGLEKEWTKYPVLYLDINSGKYTEQGSLVAVLNAALVRWEAQYGSDPSEKSLALRFIGVIRRAHAQTGHGVVILVDEYDKPMLQTISDAALQAEHRGELKTFYSVLKTMDGYIRFAFLTGVTKFGKISVFSDLNNLYDLSMDRRYVELCGLTQQEIVDNFSAEVDALAASNGLTREACLETLRRRFDGYHFEVNTVGMYNPFSVLNTLSSRAFRNYWFETGTPSFLVEMMKHVDFPLSALQTQVVDTDVLNCVDPLDQSPIPVIYQSGYLTLKDFDPEFQVYTLDFPNDEVREGFLKYLIPYYTPQEKGDGINFVRRLRNAANEGRAATMMRLLQDFFDAGDYRVAGKKEVYFQNAMFVLFRLLGFYTQVELATARGRVDLTIETPRFVYVAELKLDGTPEQALAQIEKRGYARKFASDPRMLYRLGVNFSSETRGIAGWLIDPPATDDDDLL